MEISALLASYDHNYNREMDGRSKVFLNTRREM